MSLGDSKQRDILSLHCGEKFLDTCFFACAYGLMAQALDTMENYRWTGPLRFVGMVFHNITLTGIYKPMNQNAILQFKTFNVFFFLVLKPHFVQIIV